MTDDRLKAIIDELNGWLEERRNAPPRRSHPLVPTIPWETPAPRHGCAACAGGGVCGCTLNTPVVY